MSYPKVQSLIRSSHILDEAEIMSSLDSMPYGELRASDALTKFSGTEPGCATYSDLQHLKESGSRIYPAGNYRGLPSGIRSESSKKSGDGDPTPRTGSALSRSGRLVPRLWCQDRQPSLAQEDSPVRSRQNWTNSTHRTNLNSTLATFNHQPRGSSP